MQTASNAEAFFLDAADGKRFCIFHAVDQATQCRGAVLFVPAFGEEMNKSRRMLALQARVLAQHGFASLLIDLHGCGDSDGDLRDASWDSWKNDISLAHSWLQQRCTAPVSLLGLRLGAILALDFICNDNAPVHRLIMWQPVLNGQQFLTQFYRVQIANAMLNNSNESGGGTKAIRQLLAQGEVVEIAGYEISPKLSATIDALNAHNFLPKNISLHWFEIQTEIDDHLSPAKQKIVNFWKANQSQIQLHKFSGAEFWATQEVSTNADLIGLTSALLTQTSS